MHEEKLSDKDLQDLRDFLNELQKDSGTPTHAISSDSVISPDVLDSLSVTKLILFLENRFDVNLYEKVRDISDLDSFDKIVRIISSK